MLLVELQTGGVPPAAATALARRGIPLATLKNFSVEWAVARLTEKEVTLSESEWQQLAFVVAPGANRNVPLSAQAPSEQAQPLSAQVMSEQAQPVQATPAEPQSLSRSTSTSARPPHLQVPGFVQRGA